MRARGNVPAAFRELAYSDRGGSVRLLFLAIALSLCTAGAHAQDRKAVQVGSSVIIATSDKPFGSPGASKGTVTIVESKSDPKSYSLLYLPPSTATDTTDTVTYSTDGKTYNVPISVNAEAQPPTLTSAELYSQSFKVLFVLFIIAVILESGLSVIFNWRPFIQLFDSRGMKTIISVGFALFFVSVFDLDVTTRLINVYSGSNFPVNLPGKIVTALVLAGGSSGVNNLLVALGFRSVKTEKQDAPQPPPTEAWVSVRLLRNRAKGPVTVRIGPDGNALPVAGTIVGSSSGNRLLQYFLRDQGRFPTAGGFAVTPGQACQIRLEGVDATGASITSANWGPYPLAPGAIVDLELRL